MKNLLLILCLTILTFSCQKKQEEVKEEPAEASPAFEAQRNTFFSNLKAPAEVAAQLQATAAEFNASLLSDPKNYGSYANDHVKAAANLGIYLSDLNYSVAYKQSANTKELFMAAHELSKAIGIEQGILDFLMKRFNDNINQNDSAKAVLNELFEKSTINLQGTDREKLVGITMSAYQIENLHLALGVIESYPKDMLPTDTRTQILIPIFRMVLEQKQNVENIYGFLKSVTDPTNPDKNPNYAYYANAFEELIGVYNRLNVDEKIANNQGIELMNDAVVKELGEKVNAIRSKIVSVQ
ncbi:MAG TPA: hypothetical protein VFW11_08070 [Cyclobacteriaceae bacterium]|nr:hypothetical protein [Cyclobacteriaceae bacterium]